LGCPITFEGIIKNSKGEELTDIEMIWYCDNIPIGKGKIIQPDGSAFSAGSHIIKLGALNLFGKYLDIENKSTTIRINQTELTIIQPQNRIFTIGDEIMFQCSVKRNNEDIGCDGNLKYTWLFEGEKFEEDICVASKVVSESLSEGTHTVVLQAVDTIDSCSKINPAEIQITIEKKKLEVKIESPATGAKFTLGENISFAGSAKYSDGTPIDDTEMKWFSSIDGEIGYGRGFSTNKLTKGEHTISLIAPYSKPEIKKTAEIQITVDKRLVPPHGIPDRCHGIPDQCHGIENRCHGIPDQCPPAFNCPRDKDDLQDGVCTGEWGVDAWRSATYVHGVLSGPFGRWYNNCKPISYHGNYVNGQLDGILTELVDWLGYFIITTYSEGIPQSLGWWNYDCTPTGRHGNYVNGKEDGVWTELAESWKIYTKATYSNGNLEGTYGQWTYDCTPTGGHGTYVNGLRDGVWIDFNEFQLQREYVTVAKYSEGILNGPYGQWNNNCKPAGVHGNYVNGKKEGLWTEFPWTGGYVKATYVNGVLNGPYDSYNDDGSGWSGNYVNGQQSGVWTLYRSDGSINFTETY